MKHLLRVLAHLACCLVASICLPAQKRISTPGNPVNICQVGNEVFILCDRVDVNGDRFENFPIDSPPSFTVVDATSHQLLRSKKGGWSSSQLSRIGISPMRMTFDIAFSNRVVYRIYMKGLFNGPTIFEGPCSSVSTTPDGKTVWVAQRPNDADPGTIIEIDADTGRRRSFPSGINTQAPLQFTTDKGDGLAAICEGTYGRADGSLEIWTNLQGTPKRKTLYVGDTPNHLLIHKGRAYVAVYLSHRILVVDLAAQRPIDTLYVGTSGFDGPRECVIDTAAPDGKERLFVTTHSGDVRVFDLATSERTGTLDVGAKSEGLAIVGRELWATRTYVKGGYEVTSDIAVFNLDGPSSVQTDVHRTPPAAILALGEIVRLPFVLEENATITDLTGKTTPVSAVVSDAQTLDCRHLTSGVYALRSGEHSVTIIR